MGQDKRSHQGSVVKAPMTYMSL